MAVVSVTLSNPEKWNVFYPETEMIVTKKRGRVIFPHLDFKIRGLQPESLYTMHIHLERVDGSRYTFDTTEGWKQSGIGDAPLPIRQVEHPEGARLGSHWMKNNVSFASLKITNDQENTDPKMIVVQSMHKYQPVVSIRMVGVPMDLDFRVEETQFIAVTQYQNHKIIALKVEHNPFASAFRKNGKKRASDSSSCPSESSSPEAKRTAASRPETQLPLQTIHNTPPAIHHNQLAATWEPPQYAAFQQHNMYEMGQYQPMNWNQWNQWENNYYFAS